MKHQALLSLNDKRKKNKSSATILLGSLMVNKQEMRHFRKIRI